MPHETSLITTIAAAFAQILFSTALGCATAMLWGWSFGAGLVFGLALSVASTVVLLRQENAGVVFMGEHELAKAMTEHVVGRMGEKAFSRTPETRSSPCRPRLHVQRECCKPKHTR
jgi:dienelactone hydrolase